MQSQRAQEAGGPSEVAIMESRETEPEACMYVGSEHVESDSSDNEDIEPVLKTTRSPSIVLGGSPRSPVKSPPKVAGNNDKGISSTSTFRHQEPPEQRPAVSGAPSLPLPPQRNISRHFTQPPIATSFKRKREKESSAMTPQRSMKRAETSKGEEERVDEATAIYKQLTNNVKLTDDTLQFLTKALVSWYPMEQGKVKVLDPLWFKVDGTTTGHNIKLDGYTKLCFSIHHLKPKHWTLAIVDIDDDAKSMAALTSIQVSSQVFQSLESLLGISGHRKSLKQQLDAASIKTEAGRTTLADLPTVQIGCKKYIPEEYIANKNRK
ncbi:hypothetical protein ACKRZS_008186, partial [Fusarium odoratissimum]